MTELHRQISRFAIVGMAATAVHIAMALCLNGLAAIPPLRANVLAFLMAWVISYLGNRGWTFAATTRHGVAMPRFLAVSLAGFAVNQALVFIITDLAGQPLWMAMIPVAVIVPAVSFLLSRLWVFAAHSRGTC